MPPSRFQRSRALWDNCHNTKYNHDETPGAPSWQLEQVNRYLRAILYEMQPIRYSILISNVNRFYRCFFHLSSNAIIWSRHSIPLACNQIINSVRCLSWNQWKWTTAIALYYVFLRWIHATLDAGPVVIIMTALVVIFTVGLSDENDANALSAYSVFNKGFQKIMGSIEADDLLQQHLGGGGLMQMMHRQQMADDLDLDDEPLRRRPRQQIVRGGNIDNPADGDHQEHADNNDNQNQARRTGKKARRDRAANEQRREIRAQRDAALAMGFGQINDDDLVAGIMDQ